MGPFYHQIPDFISVNEVFDFVILMIVVCLSIRVWILYGEEETCVSVSVGAWKCDFSVLKIF